MVERVTKQELAKAVPLSRCKMVDQCSKRGVWVRKFIDRETEQVIGFYVSGKWPDGEYTKYYKISK